MAHTDGPSYIYNRRQGKEKKIKKHEPEMYHLISTIRRKIWKISHNFTKTLKVSIPKTELKIIDPLKSKFLKWDALNRVWYFRNGCQFSDSQSSITALTIRRQFTINLFSILNELSPHKKDSQLKNWRKGLTDVNGKVTFPSAHVKMTMCVSAKAWHTATETQTQIWKVTQTHTGFSFQALHPTQPSYKYLLISPE